ncbi:MAG TPA: hypothetical protein VMF14_20180 [Solirubrobacteraceae bacterium]|nr:hypothetical protein [Solirubrobacteraceae bacterium]
MRWASAIAAAGAALALATAPAAMAAAPVPAHPAQPPTVITTVPVRATGGLFVQFHSDPGAGCARWGLCGYSGNVSWQPTRSDSLQIVRVGGRHPQVSLLLVPSLNASADFAGGVTTANVAQAGGDATAAGAHCSDAADVDQPILEAHGTRSTVSLGSASPSVLDTRCAGPRDADVLPHLPVRTLPLATLQRGRRAISLAAVHALHAHGLSGTITSTFVLHLGRPGPPRVAGDGGSHGPAELGREIHVFYRASLRGRILEEVRGAADPLACAPLGSCATTGTVTLSAHAHSATASLIAVAHPGTPRRQLLAAVGLAPPGPGGAGGVRGVGVVAWRGGGSVQSDLTQGTDSCRDTLASSGGELTFATSGTRLRVMMPVGDSAASPLLATRCPGPTPAAGQLAGATVPLSALRHRTARIVLTRPSATHDDGYVVRFVPHLTLTLTRIRVTTRTIPFFTGSFFGN